MADFNQAIKILSEDGIKVTRIRKKNSKELSKTEEFFPFSPITPEELLVKRVNGEHGICYKKGNKLFYGNLPDNFNLMLNNSLGLGPHLCATCQRLSPSSDCNGGCAKVRDRIFSITLLHYRNNRLALLKSKRIEKYPFIEEGYEGIDINSKKESTLVLSVTKCSQYKKIIKKEETNTTLQERRKNAFTLYQYLHPEIDFPSQKTQISEREFLINSLAQSKKEKWFREHPELQD